MKILPIIDAFGAWVKNSPKALAIVSISSLISFLIAISNGYFSFKSQLEENARTPQIAISSITTSKRKAVTNLGQVLGSGVDYAIEGPLKPIEHSGVKMPFLNLKLKLLNPSRHPTTFMKCALTANFRDKSNFTSEGYVETAKYLSGERTTGNSQYYLRPGEATEIDLMFFFLPTKELLKVWEDKTNILDINDTSVVCINEFGQNIGSQ